jgi:putative lipoic acid-binding regulatory protein
VSNTDGVPSGARYRRAINMPGFEKTKPRIDYPCPWLFKVIGSNREDLARAIAGVMGERQHLLFYSHASRTGKYHSFNLEVVVESESHRDELYRSLAACAVIKAVL